MKRDRCPVCHAPADQPCRRIVFENGVARWVDLERRHPLTRR